MVFAVSWEMIMILKYPFFYAIFPINKKLLSPELAMEQTASNLRYLAGQIYALMLLKSPEVGDEGIT